MLFHNCLCVFCAFYAFSFAFPMCSIVFSASSTAPGPRGRRLYLRRPSPDPPARRAGTRTVRERGRSPSTPRRRRQGAPMVPPPSVPSAFRDHRGDLGGVPAGDVLVERVGVVEHPGGGSHHQPRQGAGVAPRPPGNSPTGPSPPGLVGMAAGGRVGPRVGKDPSPPWHGKEHGAGPGPGRGFSQEFLNLN